MSQKFKALQERYDRVMPADGMISCVDCPKKSWKCQLFACTEMSAQLAKMDKELEADGQ